MRVLYVEDDEISASAVELMLREVGHECDRTGRGEDAIRLAKAKDYDFILLDVMLPDIDGYQVIKQLRAEGVTTPYLIQSALVDRDSEFGGLAFGSSEYLIKPFTKAELVGRMEAVIARAKLAASVQSDNPDAGQNAGTLAPGDRRRHRRFKTIKNAWIDVGSGIDCKIVNLSHAGASVRLPDAETDLPPTFDLKLETGAAYRCRLCWQLRDRIGVEFLEAYD